MINENYTIPFKYKTIGYVQKILACPEVEDYAKEFRLKEPRYKNWVNTD
jgi:hypothetical protein